MPAKCSEADIENTCTQLLELDGWRSFKMEQNFSERKRKTVGEAGMPDRLYIRPIWIGEPKFVAYAGAGAEVLWVEWKRLQGKKATKTTQAQKDWHLLARAQGFLIYVAGEDFEATIDGFKSWYLESGLNRRIVR